MRIIHTADWHLGHALRGFSRLDEQREFLQWLTELLVKEDADALVVAGDIFDSANPPTAATAELYRFIATVKKRLPDLDLVFVAGNHDSAPRLDAPQPLLTELGVRMVGQLPRLEDKSVDWAQLIVPLTDEDGEVRAHLLAMPFLRPSDVKSEALQEEMAKLYQEGVTRAQALREPGQALLATGHLTIQGAKGGHDSERMVQGGGAVTEATFPQALDFVFLGHLHLAQTLGERLHYAGSPLPLSMAELDYQHQVMVIDVMGKGRISVKPVLIPRPVAFLRLPATGEATLAELKPALQALPNRGDGPEWRRPFLELRLYEASPPPDLRAQLESLLAGKEARLVKLSLRRPESSGSLADGTHQALSELTPEEVFRERYLRDHPGEALPPTLAAAFAELLTQVKEEELR